MRLKFSTRALLAACAGLLLSIGLDAWGGTLRPMSGMTQVAVGVDHACGTTAFGGVRCWGENAFGQVGDGGPTLVDRLLPVNVSLPAAATQLALGGRFSCALLEDGAVWCWGDNQEGQLGNPAVIYASSVPVPVTGLAAPAVAITAAGMHACALLQDGGLQCWGGNTDGQLGDDSTTRRAVPVAVPLPGPVTQVAAGYRNTCAISGGGVWCWGNNSDGQLGVDDFESRDQPARVTIVSGTVVSIGVGHSHACAAMADGMVRCWGNNHSRQLGLEHDSLHEQGRPVRNLTAPVVGLAVGPYGACALGNDGNARCWGANFWGEIGTGTLNSMRRAAPVDLAADIESMSLGWFLGCFLDSAGRVHCSGLPHEGQLGNGEDGIEYEPRRVALGIRAERIEAGSSHACALLDGGGVRCWGANRGGEVGDGSRMASAAPVGVPGLWTSVRAGRELTCAVDTAGRGWCWGVPPGRANFDEDVWTSPTLVVGLGSGVAELQGDNGLVCARMAVGALQCWGTNYSGQLGDGTTDPRLGPALVTGLGQGVTMFDTASTFACALQAGLVRCWGSNSNGKLGHDSGDVLSSVPVTAAMPRPAVALELGDSHACALDDLGDVYCWGSNQNGGLGTEPQVLGESRKPLKVAGLPAAATRIAVGGHHGCALLVDDSLWCWGYSFRGERGTDPRIWTAATPARVEQAPAGIADVSAGSDTTCVVLHTGRASCWGHDASGQVGDGGVNYAVPSPVLERNLDYIFDDRFED